MHGPVASLCTPGGSAKQVRGGHQRAAVGAERLVVGPTATADAVGADDDLAEHKRVTALRASPAAPDQSGWLHGAILCTTEGSPQAFVAFALVEAPAPVGTGGGFWWPLHDHWGRRPPRGAASPSGYARALPDRNGLISFDTDLPICRTLGARGRVSPTLRLGLSLQYVPT
jgi:hypothetical protein